MATVANLIDRSLRLIGQVPAGETANTTEYADALTALIDMIDEWQIDPSMIYAIREESVTLVSSQNSYTIGPSGNLVTTRPSQIDTAYVLLSGTSYPVTVIQTAAEYAAVSSKTMEASYPTHIYYMPGMPNGTLYVYPEATNTSAVLRILTRTPLTVFTAITETVSLPPGYRKALAANLALELAPEYETAPSAEVVKMARESKANVKRANSRPIKGSSEVAALINGRSSNILTDQ